MSAYLAVALAAAARPGRAEGRGAGATSASEPSSERASSSSSLSSFRFLGAGGFFAAGAAFLAAGGGLAAGAFLGFTASFTSSGSASSIDASTSSKAEHSGTGPPPSSAASAPSPPTGDSLAQARLATGLATGEAPTASSSSAMLAGMSLPARDTGRDGPSLASDEPGREPPTPPLGALRLGPAPRTTAGGAMGTIEAADGRGSMGASSFALGAFFAGFFFFFSS